MSADSFSVTDPATWPAVLSLENVAAIYGLSVHSLRHYLRPSAKYPFSPQPYRTHPLRWRKADIERDAIGNRAVPLRRVG